jgi:hypothetical protein
MDRPVEPGEDEGKAVADGNGAAASGLALYG